MKNYLIIIIFFTFFNLSTSYSSEFHPSIDLTSTKVGGIIIEYGTVNNYNAIKLKLLSRLKTKIAYIGESKSFKNAHIQCNNIEGDWKLPTSKDTYMITLISQFFKKHYI